VSGPLPHFFVDAEGTRATAEKAGLRYLFFKREVLRKYLDTPGFGVYFHMRNWGVATTPMRQSIDVGINSLGIATAFAPDIAKLSSIEQSYWASFTRLPSGEICKELFETRMLQEPPDSPSIPEIVKGATHDLDEVFKGAISISAVSFDA
jgi:hypothetical protein